MASTKAGDAPENPRRSRVERRNRDSNVMAAAIAVMSQRGYAATSVQEIADRVGVLKGSLYHYFSSKEELLFRILQESHAEADRIADDVAAQDLPPYEELLEYLGHISRWFLRNVDRAHIYFNESRHLTGSMRKEMQQLGRQFVDHLQALIAGAQEQGSVATDMSAAILAEYVLGALNSIRDWPTRLGKQYNVDQMADAFVELTRRSLQKP